MANSIGRYPEQVLCEKLPKARIYSNTQTHGKCPLGVQERTIEDKCATNMPALMMFLANHMAEVEWVQANFNENELITMKCPARTLMLTTPKDVFGSYPEIRYHSLVTMSSFSGAEFEGS